MSDIMGTSRFEGRRSEQGSGKRVTRAEFDTLSNKVTALENKTNKLAFEVHEIYTLVLKLKEKKESKELEAEFGEE